MPTDVIVNVFKNVRYTMSVIQMSVIQILPAMFETKFLVSESFLEK